MVELKILTQPLIDAMDDRLFHKVGAYSDPSLISMFLSLAFHVEQLLM